MNKSSILSLFLFIKLSRVDYVNYPYPIKLTAFYFSNYSLNPLWLSMCFLKVFITVDKVYVFLQP